MDNHTPEQRKKNMQAIKSKDTEIELILRKELWSRGHCPDKVQDCGVLRQRILAW